MSLHIIDTQAFNLFIRYIIELWPLLNDSFGWLPRSRFFILFVCIKYHFSFQSYQKKWIDINHLTYTVSQIWYIRKLTLRATVKRFAY